VFGSWSGPRRRRFPEALLWSSCRAAEPGSTGDGLRRLDQGPGGPLTGALPAKAARFCDSQDLGPAFGPSAACRHRFLPGMWPFQEGAMADGQAALFSPV